MGRYNKSIKTYSVPGALEQLITNLISNSLQHGFPNSTDEGTISLNCSTNDDKIIIDYRDSGIGMDAKTVEQIFEPFFTLNRDKGGSGLGMFVSYNLVTTQLGGEISCESKPGEGVHFHTTLPITEPPQNKVEGPNE